MTPEQRAFRVNAGLTHVRRAIEHLRVVSVDDEASTGDRDMADVVDDLVDVAARLEAA
jgi:hypothetical protein